MTRYLAAMIAILLPLLASAGTVQIDAQYVASNTAYTAALSDGKPFDLGAYEAVQIHVDNTLGTAFRDLTMVMFAPDGVTTIDSVLLRKIGYGTAPTGSSYAPGRVRGYIGPNPQGGTSGVYTLYDGTSGSAASLNTGILWVEDCDAWQVKSVAGANTTAGACYDVRDDDTEIGVPGPTAALTQGFSWSSGSTSVNYGAPAGVANSAALWGAARRIRVTTGAATGTTVRTVVTCLGRPPGTFAHQIALPPKAKFVLGAGTGSGPTGIWINGVMR
jgi:hypothetical protein